MGKEEGKPKPAEQKKGPEQGKMDQKKPAEGQGKPQEAPKVREQSEYATPAEVVEIVGKTGVYGEIMQVMCKVLDGRDRGRVIRRNVKGPVRFGDTLMLMRTDNEAKPIRAK